MYKITAIKKAYKPEINHRLIYSWNTLTRFLVMPRDTPQKKELPLWSPAIFTSDTQLKNETVDVVSLAVFDIDNGLPFSTHESFMDYQYIAHTSFSHTPQHNKWRLVIPFEEPIPSYLWTFVWGKLHKFFQDTTGKNMDVACKDARRFYYLPAGGKHYQYKVNESGRTLGYDLGTLHQEYKEHKEKEKKLREERQREKERLADMPEYTRDFNREFKDNLRFERGYRMSLAQRVGAKVATDRAVHFTCPRCQRKDATFFYLDPIVMWDENGEAYSMNHHAYCFHKESCGNGNARKWTLWGLAREMGVA